LYEAKIRFVLSNCYKNSIEKFNDEFHKNNQLRFQIQIKNNEVIDVELSAIVCKLPMSTLSSLTFVEPRLKILLIVERFSRMSHSLVDSFIKHCKQLHYNQRRCFLHLPTKQLGMNYLFQFFKDSICHRILNHSWTLPLT
jgi:hypothetical protein